MSYRDKEGYYEASTLLGQQVAKIKDGKFLSKTACMDQQTRELMAILDFVEKGEDTEGKKEIEEIKPLFQDLGRAKWQRDVITDLALLLGKPETVKNKSVIR